MNKWPAHTGALGLKTLLLQQRLAPELHLTRKTPSSLILNEPSTTFTAKAMTDDSPKKKQLPSPPVAKKVQLTVTPVQHERLLRLASLHDMTIAHFSTLILNQWLFENYEEHLRVFS